MSKKQPATPTTEEETVETVTPDMEQFVPEGDFLTLLTPKGFATARLSDPQFRTDEEVREYLRQKVRDGA